MIYHWKYLPGNLGENLTGKVSSLRTLAKRIRTKTKEFHKLYYFFIRIKIFKIVDHFYQTNY